MDTVEVNPAATSENATAPVASKGPTASTLQEDPRPQQGLEESKSQAEGEAEAEAEAGKSPYAVQFPVVCPGHSRPVVDVRYSRVTPDGVFMISACHDKKPMIRWGDNGDWIGTLAGHKGAVWSAALNHDATRAATGSADFSVKLWNAVTGADMHTFQHKHIVKSVEFSPEGTKLASGGLDKRLKVFDLADVDRKELLNIDNKAKIRKASWLDTTTLLCADEEGHLNKYDLRTGEACQTVEFMKSVRDLEISPQLSKFIVAGGKTIRIYDTSTFDMVHEQELNFDIEGACHGHAVVSLSKEVSSLHSLDNGEEIATHKGHHGPIFCMRYAPDGKSYASGSEDGTIRLWK